MSAAAGVNELRLDFLPTKAESTLERCAMLGLKRVESDLEVFSGVERAMVVMEKQRLASEWQRHQLVPPTPTPKMNEEGRPLKARRRLRDHVRDAFSGMLDKVASAPDVAGLLGKVSRRTTRSAPDVAGMAATKAPVAQISN